MNQKKIEFWIITSTEDIASMNLRDILLKNYNFQIVNENSDPWKIWSDHPTYLLNLSESVDDKILAIPSKYLDLLNIRLVLTDDRMIFLDKDLDKIKLKEKFGADFIIFASRHRSESKLPAILTHSTGNWNSDNSHGGTGNSIALSSAILLGIAYRNLLRENEISGLNWPVDLEVNHHGPTELPAPLIFMELGSSEENWNDHKGGITVSNAIIKTIFDYFAFLFTRLKADKFLESSEFSSREKLYEFIKKNSSKLNLIIAIGFGGPHYARNFSLLYNKNQDVYISHIIPKYFINGLTIDMVKQMLDNTIENVNTILIDWRGVNSAGKKLILEICESLNIQIRKTKEFSNK